MILRKVGLCGVGRHVAALRLDARSASADSLQYSEKNMGQSSLSDRNRGPRFVRVAATLRPACCGLDVGVLCPRGFATWAVCWRPAASSTLARFTSCSAV
eukprot:1107647-Pyramimonas_sp.AAC.1